MKNVKKKESKINWWAVIIILMGFSALREGGALSLYISPIFFGLGETMMVGRNWKESFSAILTVYGILFLFLSLVLFSNYYTIVQSTSLTFVSAIGSLYIGIFLTLIGYALWKSWEQSRIGIIFIIFGLVTIFFLLIDVFIYGAAIFFLARLVMVIMLFGIGYCFKQKIIKKERYNLVGLITFLAFLAFIGLSPSQSTVVEKTYLGNSLLAESGVLAPNEYKAYEVNLAANEDTFIRLNISSGRANTLLMNVTEYEKLVNGTKDFIYYYEQCYRTGVTYSVDCEFLSPDNNTYYFVVSNMQMIEGQLGPLGDLNYDISVYKKS